MAEMTGNKIKQLEAATSINGTDDFIIETSPPEGSPETKRAAASVIKEMMTHEVNLALEDKAAKTHTHDDRYYTENEMNTKLKAKSDTSHTHNAIKTKSGSNSLQFDWVLEGGTWKLKLYVDGTFVKTF